MQPVHSTAYHISGPHLHMGRISRIGALSDCEGLGPRQCQRGIVLLRPGSIAEKPEHLQQAPLPLATLSSSGKVSEGESNISNGPSVFPPKEPSRSNAAASSMIACSSKEATWLPSISADKDSPFKNMGVLSSMGGDRTGRQARDAELQVNLEKKPAIDELDRMVRLKQAEAKMYQERADDARREAEGLKRIAVAKNVKTEEDYATHIAKLRLREAEERRRQKLEELQGVEREHREYFNLKTRMEADIKDLLVKMEATRRNFST